jgi:hypothetical protein
LPRVVYNKYLLGTMMGCQFSHSWLFNFMIFQSSAWKKWTFNFLNQNLRGWMSQWSWCKSILNSFFIMQNLDGGLQCNFIRNCNHAI